MIQAQRLAHATIETPDIQRAIDYYVGVNGLVEISRDANGAWLATKLGQLAIALVKGVEPSCTRMSFEVAPNVDLAEAAKTLAAKGVKAEVRRDPFPGTPRSLTFVDPAGISIDLFNKWNFIAPNQNVAGIGPLKVGHVAFFVEDLHKQIEFYQNILGFRVSDWIGDLFVFMRCSPDHHTVNFFSGGPTRLHHLALELKDFAHVNQACETLSMHRIPLGWGPLRHGPGHNVAAYHRNHDDHVIEYYCELDQMKNEDLGYFEPRPWHVDRPQRPKVWPARTWVSGWGVPPAPDFGRNERALGATKP
jgi:catechol 2,3-dioxygenase-like lactoylglutathione lyase family enzyme